MLHAHNKGFLLKEATFSIFHPSQPFIPFSSTSSILSYCPHLWFPFQPSLQIELWSFPSCSSIYYKVRDIFYCHIIYLFHLFISCYVHISHHCLLFTCPFAHMWTHVKFLVGGGGNPFQTFSYVTVITNKTFLFSCTFNKWLCFILNNN